MRGLSEIIRLNEEAAEEELSRPVGRNRTIPCPINLDVVGELIDAAEAAKKVEQ
jgi:hypothetical protein